MNKVYIVLWVYTRFHDERKYIEGVFKSEDDARRYINERVCGVRVQKISKETEQSSSSKYEIEEWDL